MSRLVIVGVGKPRDLKPQDFVKLGGVAMGKIPAAASEATIVADLPGGGIKPDRIADIALGVRLRGYAFERYKTKRKDDEETRRRGQAHHRGRRASRRSRRRSRRARPWPTA